MAYLKAAVKGIALGLFVSAILIGIHQWYLTLTYVPA